MVREDQLLADIDAILGEQGVIAQEPGYRYSRQQHEYARRAGAGLVRFDAAAGRAAINMLQAATGTGKTLGYLVPLMLYAARSKPVARVAISTYTRHLQKQIEDKDAVVARKWVKERTGKDLTVAVRLGIGNFGSAVACARHRDALAKQGAAHFEEAIAFLDDLIDWLDETDKHGQPVHSGILHDYFAQVGLSACPNGIVLDRIALDFKSPESEQSAYKRMAVISRKADVLIVNHALLAMNAYRWASLLDDRDKRRIAALVCDEADRLPDAAESVLSTGIALHSLTSACDAVGLPTARDAAAALYAYATAFKVPAKEAMAITQREAFAHQIETALKVMRPAAAQGSRFLASSMDMVDEIRSEKRRNMAVFVDAVNELAAIAEAIGRPDNSAIVTWSPVRQYPSLCVGKPNSARILSRLWAPRDWEDNPAAPPRSYLDAVLFTSATLEVPGQDLPRAFDDLASAVGVIRHPHKTQKDKNGNEPGQPIHNVCLDLYGRFEPDRFGSMEVVLADPRVVAPTLSDCDDNGKYVTNPDWLDYAATMIRQAAQRGGRTLVLALSWQDTAALAKRLADLPQLVEHKQGQPLQEVKNQYVAKPDAVMISPSAWEGVDLPGMVNQLVVTRIPYAPLGGGADLIRRVDLEARGYDKDRIDSILQKGMENGTRRKLAQGLGRGIRKVDDCVTVWIADPRFPLPESFSDSLDEVLMDAPPRRTRPVLRHCIPLRFRETTYQQAALWLLDGRLYSPLA